MSPERVEDLITKKLEQSIRRIVESVHRSCGVPNPPGTCQMISEVLPADVDEAVALLRPLIGDYDARVDGAECSSEVDCDAVSICILAELSPARIHGIGEFGARQ